MNFLVSLIFSKYSQPEEITFENTDNDELSDLEKNHDSSSKQIYKPISPKKSWSTDVRSLV